MRFIPAYLLRAYSWAMALFAPSRQTEYGYTLEGDGEALGRPAWIVSFDPIPPFVEEINDWFGTVRIDRETFQPLRVRAYDIRDWGSVQAFSGGVGDLRNVATVRNLVRHSGPMETPR